MAREPIRRAESEIAAAVPSGGIDGRITPDGLARRPFLIDIGTIHATAAFGGLITT